MATTIIQGKSDGRITGRCDATCHKAQGPDCDCCCGGVMHGAAARMGGVPMALRRLETEWVQLVEAARQSQRELRRVEYQLVEPALLPPNPVRP